MDFNLDLDLKFKLFKEHLDNGGIERIKFKEMLEALLEVRCDDNGKVVPDTLDSILRAAMNAYVGSLLSPPSTSKQFLSEYKAFIQKEIFFNQRNIDTIEEFENLLTEFEGQEGLLFRGLNEAKYRLYSSLQRQWIKNKFYDRDISTESFLRTIIDNAKKEQGHVLDKYFKNIRFDPENDLSILSFLQHNGCPTPLVDWTYSLFNALFFATNTIHNIEPKREIDKYFSVYFIEEKYLSAGDEIIEALEKGMELFKPKVKDQLIERMKKNNVADEVIAVSVTDDIVESMTLFMHAKRSMAHLTKIKNLLISPLLYFSETKNKGPINFPLNNNLNIVNQQGVFIWNSSTDFPIEHIARAEYYDEETDEGYMFSNCLNINKELRPYIIEKLEKMGITNDFIFPDAGKIAIESFNKTVEQFSSS